MFELKVTVSDGRYTGMTQVYDTSDSLSAFAKYLIGFPKDDKPIKYETGKGVGHESFSISFYCIDLSGHIAVEVLLEEPASIYGVKKRIKLPLQF